MTVIHSCLVIIISGIISKTGVWFTAYYNFLCIPVLQLDINLVWLLL